MHVNCSNGQLVLMCLAVSVTNEGKLNPRVSVPHNIGTSWLGQVLWCRSITS